MNERAIKLRHLRCFREVARQGTVVRAAERLSVSQPAVSKSLRELEEALGVALLERGRKGVTLTAAGERFLEHVDGTLSALRRGLDTMADATGDQQSLISVGVLPTVAARLMPEVVRRHTERGAGPTVRVISAPNPDLIDRLRLGDLELVVGRLSQPDLMVGLNFEYLYSERLSFVVRPGHPMLACTPFDLHRLGEHVVLMPGPDMIIAPSVARFLLARGVNGIANRIENDSNHFGRAFTRETDAIWIISHGVVANDLAEGALAELAVDTADTAGAVGLTTLADGAPTPATRAFMTVVREVAAAVRM